MKKIAILIIIGIFIASPVLAEKVRVFYRPDGGVSVTSGAEESFDSHMKKLPPYNGVKFEDMPYEDIDASQLPIRDKNRNKWRGTKGQGVHIDHSIKLKREKVEEAKQALDEELAKPQPDVVEVIKLRRKLEKLFEEPE